MGKDNREYPDRDFDGNFGILKIDRIFKVGMEKRETRNWCEYHHCYYYEWCKHCLKEGKYERDEVTRI